MENVRLRTSRTDVGGEKTTALKTDNAKRNINT